MHVRSASIRSVRGQKERGPGFLVESPNPLALIRNGLQEPGHNVESFRAGDSHVGPRPSDEPDLTGVHETLAQQENGDVVRSPMCSFGQSATKAADAASRCPACHALPRKGRPPATQNMSADGLNQPAV